MRKLVYVLGLMVLVASCSQEPQDMESAQKKISEYKMQIVDIENKIEALENKFNTDSKKQSSILVGTLDLKPTKFVNYVEVTGNIEAQNEALVSPEINGQIEDILVKEGEHVTKGQLLFSLKTDVIERNIAEIKTSLSLATTLYEKQKQLWNQKIGSEIQYLQSKNNKESMEKRLSTLNAQLNMANVRAPFSGYVEEIFQKTGEIASPGRQVLQLVNLDDLKVTADVSEAYLPKLKKGNDLNISFPTFPNLSVDSKISYVGYVINPNNRTVKIQANIKNESQELKPNIIANIQFKEFEKDSSIVIPSIIIKNDAEGHKYVYVAKKVNDNEVATKKFITTGRDYGNKTLILSGLNFGDRLIYQGYNTVKNGSLIHTK